MDSVLANLLTLRFIYNPPKNICRQVQNGPDVHLPGEVEQGRLFLLSQLSHQENQRTEDNRRQGQCGLRSFKSGTIS
jgi:hypothetical protein